MSAKAKVKSVLQPILLPGFESVAFFKEAAPGSGQVQKIDANYYLKGRFTFCFYGAASAILNFGLGPGERKAEVSPLPGGGWVLKATDLSDEGLVTLNTPVRFQREVAGRKIGPWLDVFSLALVVGEQTEGKLLFWVTRFKASLLAKQRRVGDNSVLYPKRIKGKISVGTRPLDRLGQTLPSGFKVKGYFLYADEAGISMQAVGIRQPGKMSIEPIKFYFVSIPDDVDIRFQLPTSVAASGAGGEDLAVVFRSFENAPKSFAFEFSRQRNLLLAGSNRYAGDLVVRVAGGYMSARPQRRSVTDSLTLAHKPTAAQIAWGHVSGSPEHFRYVLPMNGDSDPVSEKWFPYFAYVNAGVLERKYSEVTPLERYHGLQLNNLLTGLDAPLRLDANYIKVYLKRKVAPTRSSQKKLSGNQSSIPLKNTEFHFLAGSDQMSLPGLEPDTVQSRVIPKWLPVAPGKSSERRLDLPVGYFSLELPYTQEALQSPVLFSTEAFPTGEGNLILRGVSLVAAPNGSPAAQQANLSLGSVPEAYSRWQLKPQDNQLNFRLLRNKGFFPTEKDKWVEPFKSQPDEFRLLDYPGAGLGIGSSSPSILAAKVETEVEVIQVGSKELLVYSAVSMYLIYKAIRAITVAKTQALDVENIRLQETGLGQVNMKEIKSRGVGDLVFEYKGSGLLSRLKNFIDLNRQPVNAQIDFFYWPLLPGLGIPLWGKKKEGQEYYLYDLAKANTGIRLDLSKKTYATGETFLDYGAADFQRLAKDAPALWPKQSAKNKNDRLDPSVGEWEGVFFREVPIKIVLEDIDRSPRSSSPVSAKKTLLPLLEEEADLRKKLLNEINAQLWAEYAWIDANGTTWKAKADTLIDLFDNSFIVIKVVDFETLGAASKVVTASGLVRLTLPWLKDKQGVAYQVEADFFLNFQSKKPLEKLEVSTQGGFSKTDSFVIPGIKSIQGKSIWTDFKSVYFRVALWADDNLIDIFPALGRGPLVGAFFIGLTDDSSRGPSRMALALDAEIKTNLFGLWPVTIQGLEYTTNPTPLLSSRLRFLATLDLGIPAFSKASVRVVLDKQSDLDSDWEVSVELEEVAGKIGFGDISLEGQLNWAEFDEQAPSLLKDKPVPAADVVAETKNRDLWGWFKLKLFDNAGGDDALRIGLKIGNREELSFWVASLYSNTSFKIANARISDPGLLLAKNADFVPQGGTQPTAIREAVLNAAPGKLAEFISPPQGADDDERKKNAAKWMQSWQPSNEVGFVIGGSGKLEMHPVLAKKSETKKTALLFVQGGLIRVDSSIRLLGVHEADIFFALDLKCKRFKAGLDIGTLEYPSKNNSQISIRPGYLQLGLGWGKHKYFLLSMGWPEKTEGETEFERNWDQAGRVYIAGMVPINTFWGGWKLEYLKRSNDHYVVWGTALRAGWTKTYKFGNSTVNVQGELGIAVGGVLEFHFILAKNFLPSGEAVEELRYPQKVLDFYQHAGLQLLSDLRAEIQQQPASPKSFNASTVLAATQVVEQGLAALTSSSLFISGTIFMDVWGSASANLFGVTLASVRIHGFARMHVSGLLSESSLKITRMYGAVGFTFTVRIGCFKYSAKATLEIWLKKGPPGPGGSAGNRIENACEALPTGLVAANDYIDV